MKQVISRSADETIAFGELLASKLSPGAVLTLHGPLGSGKTTLAKGIARHLDIAEDVTSPSFTLISEYEGRLHLYHMDLYRIDSLEEFEMLGAEELMYGEGITLIEWAEKIRELLPQNRISVVFTLNDDGSRSILVEGVEL